MDMRTNSIATIAIEWQPVTFRLPDDSLLVLIALNDDDVWTGYRDGDIWRYADAMPITSERVTHWAQMPPPPSPEYQVPKESVLPLDEQTRIILGRPNFACIRTAQRMRELGHRIGRRAEDEQAAVIHLHLTMYQKHGVAWLEHTLAYLEKGQPGAAPVAQGAPA